MNDRNQPAGTVATTKQVLVGKDRVILVVHTRDGGWLFLGAREPRERDMVFVDARRMLQHDRSLRKVWPLRSGWIARRGDHGGWMKQADDTDAPPLVSTPARGFTLQFTNRSRFEHWFCGEHTIPGAQCPNCRKPLLRMLTLDTRDRRLGLQALGLPHVHLLFCWTCHLAQGETAYRLLPNGGIRFVQHRRGGVSKTFPYRDYPRAFPGRRFTLAAVAPREARTLAALNAGEVSTTSLGRSARQLAMPRHQIGGEPRFLQGTPRRICPRCRHPMTFLASVGDDTLGGSGFTGNAFVQVLFLLCERDKIVLSLQQCD
jgi:hypothetical protein